MPEGRCRIYPQRELRAAQLPASCRPKVSLLPAYRVPLEDHAIAHDGFAEMPFLANSKAPTVTSLVESYSAANVRVHHCTRIGYASKWSYC